MAKRLWRGLLLTLVLTIAGCGGGNGGHNGNDPSDSSYIALLRPSLIRWTTTTIPIELDTTNVPSDWNPAYLGYVGNAYGRWLQNLLNVKVEFLLYPHDTTQPKVSIKWVDQVTNSSDPNAIALTKLVLDPSNGHKLLGFNVQIGLHGTDGRRLTDREVLTATVHEIGHTLGIMCHSPNENDVMYAKAYNADPTVRDLNTIEELYSQTPVVTDRHTLELTLDAADNK